MTSVCFEDVSLQKKDEQGQAVDILRNLSFSVPAGAIFALAGPSGSGKSSVLRLINRLDDSSSGRIVIQGRELRDWDIRELRAKVGFMFQEAALFEGSVKENLLYGLCLQGLRRCNHDPTALELLERVGLPPELLNRNVESLSGGQKQRVNLARTLSLEPEIILMDEPTSSLDPAATRTIENLIRAQPAGADHISQPQSEQIGRLPPPAWSWTKGARFSTAVRRSSLPTQKSGILTRGKEEANG